MNLQVIHTRDRQDRYEKLINEFSIQGITQYRLWDGVKIPGNSILSISHSHKKIVRWAYDNNLPEVCIAENDIKFFAPGAWEFFLSNKPKDFDLYLGGVFFGAIDENNLVQDFCGMTLYIVSQRFYRTFLSVKDMDNLDRALAIRYLNNFIKDTVKYYVCNPMVCSQHGGFSDNKQWVVESYDNLLQGRKLFGK